jgi:flagellar biosynthesis protein FlhG
VLLVDADEHVGPLSMLLGVAARASWQDLRGGKVSPSDVATPVNTTLTLVAGGAPRYASGPSAALSAAERRACMRRVSALTHNVDLVVIDCGSRFEAVTAAITPHAGERLVAIAAGADPIGLAATYALCKAVHARHGALPLDLLVNRHEGSEAVRCFDAIDAGVRQFLGSTLRFVGAVPSDPTLDAALRAGMPFSDAVAGSPAATIAHDVVMRTLAGTSSTRPGV